MTGRIIVDRGRGVYVHKADKESKKELEGRKWTGGSYSVGREGTRGRLWSLAMIKSNSRYVQTDFKDLSTYGENIKSHLPACPSRKGFSTRANNR